MAAELKTDLHIPDLWYDFYARLLPGILFVAGFRTVYFDNLITPSIEEMVALLIASYLIGLCSQPLSSRVSGWVQTFGERMAGIRDKLFVKRIQHQVKADSRTSLVLSKMHGEVAFFVQVTILGCIFFFTTISRPNGSYYFGFVPIISILFALEVANRRAKRAKDIEKILSNSAATAEKVNNTTGA